MSCKHKMSPAMVWGTLYPADEPPPTRQTQWGQRGVAQFINNVLSNLTCLMNMPYEYNIYATPKKTWRYLVKKWRRSQTGGQKFDILSVPNHTLGIKCVVFWDGVSSYFLCVTSFFCVCVSILVPPVFCAFWCTLRQDWVILSNLNDCWDFDTV